MDGIEVLPWHEHQDRVVSATGRDAAVVSQEWLSMCAVAVRMCAAQSGAGAIAVGQAVLIYHPPLACRPRQGRISGPLFHVLISNHGKGSLLYYRFFYLSEQLSAPAILELSSTFPLRDGDYCLEKFSPPFPLCFRLAGNTFCPLLGEV